MHTSMCNHSHTRTHTQVNRKRLLNPSGLGAGQFGMVYLATYDGGEHSFKVAVKMLQVDSGEDNQDDFRAEAEVRHTLHTLLH